MQGLFHFTIRLTAGLKLAGGSNSSILRSIPAGSGGYAGGAPSHWISFSPSCESRAETNDDSLARITSAFTTVVWLPENSTVA